MHKWWLYISILFLFYILIKITAMLMNYMNKTTLEEQQFILDFRQYDEYTKTMYIHTVNKIIPKLMKYCKKIQEKYPLNTEIIITHDKIDVRLSNKFNITSIYDPKIKKNVRRINCLINKYIGR